MRRTQSGLDGEAGMRFEAQQEIPMPEFDADDDDARVAFVAEADCATGKIKDMKTAIFESAQQRKKNLLKLKINKAILKQASEKNSESTDAKVEKKADHKEQETHPQACSNCMPATTWLAGQLSVAKLGSAGNLFIRSMQKHEVLTGTTG